MIGQALWHAKRDVRTFDVFGEVPSNHLIQQFGHALDNRRLEHIAGVSPYASLRKTT